VLASALSRSLCWKRQDNLIWICTIQDFDLHSDEHFESHLSRNGLYLIMTDSTEDDTRPKSTKSGNSNSSVQIEYQLKSQFEFVLRAQFEFALPIR
jgi:hypothetical protein